MVNKMAEDGRVAVRNIRRDAIEALKKLEKDSKITEDDLKKFQKEAQDKTDAFIKKIDAALGVNFMRFASASAAGTERSFLCGTDERA